MDIYWRISYWFYDNANKTKKGLPQKIIDLRCYPSISMPIKFGQWLKNKPSCFANITKSSLTIPRTIVYADCRSNGELNSNT